MLNRAARVMASGHGGQILVADSTARLLSGVELLDLGSRRLRDVPAPVAVFQVRASGLARTSRRCGQSMLTPGNSVGHFDGVGGVGKTRLVSGASLAAGR